MNWLAKSRPGGTATAAAPTKPNAAAASDAVAGIADGFKSAYKEMTSAASRAWEAVQDGVHSAAPITIGLYQEAAGDLKKIMEDLTKSYEKIFPTDEQKAKRAKELIHQMDEAVNQLGNSFKKSGDQASQALTDMVDKAGKVVDSEKVQALMRLIGFPEKQVPVGKIQAPSAQSLMNALSVGNQGGININEAEKMLKDAGLMVGSQGRGSLLSSLTDPAEERANQIAREIQSEQELVKTLEELGKNRNQIEKSVLDQNEKAVAAYYENIKKLQMAQNQIMLQNSAQAFDSLATGLESLVGKQNSAYKAMFAASKAFTIADAVLKIYQAGAQVLADPSATTIYQKLANYAIILSQLGTIMSAMGSVKLAFGGGKAEGGPVSSDKAYLVGEKGPELFHPSRNGTIIPNDQLGSKVAVIVNNYTDAHATVTERMEGDQKVIEVMIRRVKNEISSEVRDGRGEIHRALEQTYSLRRGKN